jgi:hypothetical protein
LDFAKSNGLGYSQDEADKIVELLISYGAKTQKELLSE